MSDTKTDVNNPGFIREKLDELISFRKNDLNTDFWAKQFDLDLLGYIFQELAV